MKFLIIRFSSIGDIVLTTPVVRCLKKQVAGVELHYLTKKVFHPVLEANPNIDKFHLLEDDLPVLTEKLKEEQFDQVIDLHHNLRTLRVKRKLNTESHSFNKLNVEKWLVTSFKWNRLPDIHIVDRYLETVSSFGVKNDGEGLDYFIPSTDVWNDENIPQQHRNGYVALAIGAAHATKRLPLHKLKELCEKIQHPVIILGGKEDAINGIELEKIDSQKVFNACGKFSINGSAQLVQKSRFIITHDTGLMHIAAAFKKRIISVWGNTIPEFGMYPYYGNTASKEMRFEIKDLYCRPCSKIGYEKCPKKHFKCMELIDISSMADVANKWFDE